MSANYSLPNADLERLNKALFLLKVQLIDEIRAATSDSVPLAARIEKVQNRVAELQAVLEFEDVLAILQPRKP